MADFGDIREMRSRALQGEANALLNARRRTVDTLSTQAQVDERRA